MECILSSKSLKSHIGDFEIHSSLKDKLQLENKNWLYCYSEYKQGVWCATMMNLIGHALSNLYQDSFSILDIGCGKSSTFKNMTTGIVNKKIIYHSIDKLSLDVSTPNLCIPRSKIVNERKKKELEYNNDEAIVAKLGSEAIVAKLGSEAIVVFDEPSKCSELTRMLAELNTNIGKKVIIIERPLDHIHHEFDVFKCNPEDVARIPLCYFHVMIIDIEPHGREIEIFEMFENQMQEEYMIIFKCIASMDMYGNQMADRVLNHLCNSRKLVDVFAVDCGDCNIRDVFAVCSRRQGGVDFIGNVYNKILKDGRLETYIGKTAVKTMVVRTFLEKILELN